jgi:hypothetical protein
MWTEVDREVELLWRTRPLQSLLRLGERAGGSGLGGRGDGVPSHGVPVCAA